MTHNIFYRDFTLAKAAALCGLMAVATLIGGSDSGGGHSNADLHYMQERNGAHILPVFVIKHADCESEKAGVSL